MLTALRLRHATTEEMRRGLGPMIARKVYYDIDTNFAVGELRKALESGPYNPADELASDVRVSGSDVIACAAGRGVREDVLKAVLGEDTLAKAFHSQEPDPIADEADFHKSDQDNRGLVRIQLVVEAMPHEVMKSNLHMGKGAREAIDCFLHASDIPLLRDRLIQAEREGVAGIRDTDVAALDAGRLRKAVVDLLWGEGYEDLGNELEQVAPDVLQFRGFAELRKTARVLDEYNRERGGDDLSRLTENTPKGEPKSHTADAPLDAVPGKTDALLAHRLWPRAELRARIAQSPMCTLLDLSLFDALALSDQRIDLLVNGERR